MLCFSRLSVVLVIGAAMAVACSGPPRSGGDQSAKQPYHVQLDLVSEKDVAAEVLGRAIKWWESQPPGERPPLVTEGDSNPKAATIVWKAPFYRVRLGPFPSRSQAQGVLEAARATFPDAFLAPARTD